MSATILAFVPRARADARPGAGYDESRAAALRGFVAEVFALIECAYCALGKNDPVTAEACLDELQETFPPAEAPPDLIDWRAGQIGSLIDAIMLAAALRGRDAQKGFSDHGR